MNYSKIYFYNASANFSWITNAEISQILDEFGATK